MMRKNSTDLRFDQRLRWTPATRVKWRLLTSFYWRNSERRCWFRLWIWRILRSGFCLKFWRISLSTEVVDRWVFVNVQLFRSSGLCLRDLWLRLFLWFRRKCRDLTTKVVKNAMHRSRLFHFLVLHLTYMWGLYLKQLIIISKRSLRYKTFLNTKL